MQFLIIRMHYFLVFDLFIFLHCCTLKLYLKPGYNPAAQNANPCNCSSSICLYIYMHIYVNIFRRNLACSICDRLG